MSAPHRLHAAASSKRGDPTQSMFPVSLQMMAAQLNASVAAAPPLSSGVEAAQEEVTRQALYVYLEDDVSIRDPVEFEARLLALSAEFPAGWDAVSLLPVDGLCARSRRGAAAARQALCWALCLDAQDCCAAPPRWLPFFPANDLIRPVLSFSRTTAMVFSAKGIQTLLSNLPADNVARSSPLAPLNLAHVACPALRCALRALSDGSQVDLWYRRLMRERKLQIYIHCGGLASFSEEAVIPVAARRFRARQRLLVVQ